MWLLQMKYHAQNRDKVALEYAPNREKLKKCLTELNMTDYQVKKTVCQITPVNKMLKRLFCIFKDLFT